VNISAVKASPVGQNRYEEAAAINAIMALQPSPRAVSMAGTHVHVVSMSKLFREERTVYRSGIP
jgi:hypothetical protein